MARFALIALLVAVACAGVRAQTIVAPCEASGLVSVPLHPAADEPVGLRVSSELLFGGGEILAAAHLANGVIVLDVVVTDEPAAFPGYKRTAKTFQDVQAWIGPLPQGEYPIRAAVRFPGQDIDDMPPCVLRPASVEVTATGGTVTAVLAVEFYNATIDRYIVTADQEIVDLDTGVHPGWVRTGEAFAVYLPGRSDFRGWPVCRFYGLPEAHLDSHFLSGRFAECNALRSDPQLGGAWVEDRANAFELPLPDTLSGACPFGSEPVYRFWNPRTGDHRYVVAPLLRAQLLQAGWIAEGDGPSAVALCTARTPLS